MRMAMVLFSSTAILGEYIFAVTLQLFSFVAFIYLLFKSQKRQHNGLELSYSMILYIFCCIFQSFFGFLHLIYLAIFWSKENVTYNAYYMFITGTFAVILLVTISNSVTFLSIDRILIVLFPTKYSERVKKITANCFMFSIIVGNVIILIIALLNDFPTTSITNCRAQTCMRKNTDSLIFAIVKYCIAGANVFVGFILAKVLNKNLKGNSINARANRIIFITMLLEITLNFLPNLIAMLFLSDQLTSVQGPHSLFLGSIEVAAAALLYSKNILKPKQFGTTVIIFNHNKNSTSRNFHI